jgi:hypothetical protein
VAHPEVEKNMDPTTGRVQKEWRRPVLRKLAISATANKQKGNEGVGGGKGDNAPIPS